MDDRDLELVRRCLAGEESAFDALYSAHAGWVMSYFLRSGFSRPDAEDLTQDAFVRAFRSLRTFDAGRGRFSRWLAAVARNVARKHWGRRAEPENFDPELAEETLSGGADSGNPGAEAAAAEEIGAVDECVKALPADLARIVRLRYVEARTTRGVAAETNIPEATVRLRLTEAVEALRRCLKEKGFLE